MSIRLIAGLGNPGAEYADTRHNVGFDFVEAASRERGLSMRDEPRFFGRHVRARFGGETVSLLEPTCWMNHSGRSVYACAAFYKLEPPEVLVVHDDLDLPPGTARLKTGGGHGGHNGLKDIVSRIGNGFHRLRLGIGHPGDASQVVSWVLSRPTRAQAALMADAVNRALASLPDIVFGDFSKVMNVLHQQP